MANFLRLTLSLSTSTESSTANQNNVECVGFPKCHVDPNSALSRTVALELEPRFSESTFCVGTVATTNPEGWASAQDWDKYRALITELYPKLMLKEIMEVMGSEHSFKATEKMYKSRFTQWGLRKNAKRKRDGDQESGREKRPIDRCSPLPTEHAGYLAQLVSAKTSRALRSSTPLPRPVMTPPILAIPERILGVMGNYFRGSFEAGTWPSHDHDGLGYYLIDKPAEHASTYLVHFYHSCIIACRLFDRKCFQDAGKMLISATARIKEILLAEEPTTLGKIFQLMLLVSLAGRHEIALIILRHFSNMAMTVLGDRHPMSQISRLLCSMDQSYFEDIAARGLSSIYHNFRTLIGPMHYTTLAAHTESISIGERREEKMRGLLGECESDLGLLKCRTTFVHVRLSFICYANHNYIEAKRLGQELLVRSRKLQWTTHEDPYRAKGLHIIAMSQYALGERQSAESHILEAIALISPIEPSRAVYWLSILEGWLLEQGQEDSATKTRERRWKLEESINPPDGNYSALPISVRTHDELRDTHAEARRWINIYGRRRGRHLDNLCWAR